jgi:hypothetical protein
MTRIEVRKIDNFKADNSPNTSEEARSLRFCINGSAGAL